MPKRAKRQKPELVNQTVAAKLVGVARQSIAGLIARGELRGENVGGLLFVVREDAERLGAERAERAAVA